MSVARKTFRMIVQMIKRILNESENTRIENIFDVTRLTFKMLTISVAMAKIQNTEIRKPRNAKPCKKSEESFITSMNVYYSQKIREESEKN